MQRGTRGRRRRKYCRTAEYEYVAGVTSKKSLKLWGTICGKKVIVLVDSGASNGYMSHDLVRELKLQQKATKEHSVEVGTGQRVRSQEVCRQVLLQLPTVQVIQYFFLFDLYGADVVLGYEWLESLVRSVQILRSNSLKHY